MRVILLKDVIKIGHKYDIKNVSDGYAMNFLIPNKLAEPATDKKIKKVATIKLNKDVENQINQNLLLKNMESLHGARVEMQVKANEKGHLFKGIHIEEIVEALKDQDHIDLKPGYIQLKQPIKEIGEFDIEAKIGDVKAVFKLIINKIS